MTLIVVLSISRILSTPRISATPALGTPIDSKIIIDSVEKTKRLLVVDGDWSSCGLSSEIISIVAENVSPDKLLNNPSRITFPDAPAPTSKILESEFYINESQIIEKVLSLVK